MMEQLNNHVIIYDLATCPGGLTIEQVVRFYKLTNFVFYDSSLVKGQAIAPYAIKANEIIPEIMIDISTVEAQQFINNRRNG